MPSNALPSPLLAMPSAGKFYVVRLVVPTDIDQRSQNLRHLYPRMGSNWGYSGFLATKITVIHQVRMYCGLSMKINTCERAKIVDGVLFAFVSSCVIVINPNAPNWSSMADNAITRGSIGVLGSPFYICGGTPQDSFLHTLTFCHNITGGRRKKTSRRRRGKITTRRGRRRKATNKKRKKEDYKRRRKKELDLRKKRKKGDY